MRIFIYSHNHVLAERQAKIEAKRLNGRVIRAEKNLFIVEYGEESEPTDLKDIGSRPGLSTEEVEE